jgi:hypothetical protein
MVYLEHPKRAILPEYFFKKSFLPQRRRDAEFFVGCAEGTTNN